MEYAIGIDLGGTSIKYALVDKAGNSFFEGKLPSFASVSAAKVMEQLIKAATLLKDEAAKQNWTVLGIGLGTPGIVDETNRIVLGGAENIVGWENIDVASLMEKQMSLPVVVGNDANLMGLGETKYGAGRGCTHVVFLTVGTGIGGAVIIDGKLFNGYANRGTELGHVPLIANGERCACGAIGCLEHYASTAALTRRFSALAKEQNLSFDTEINGELIVRLYHEKFPARCRVHERTLLLFGQRNCRLCQYLQSPTDCDRRRCCRIRQFLFRENKGGSQKARNSRLCPEYQDCSSRIGQ